MVQTVSLIWSLINKLTLFYASVICAGSKCQQLEQISSQLSAIIETKDELISRLQQPFVGEFLEIDAAHHK